MLNTQANETCAENKKNLNCETCQVIRNLFIVALGTFIGVYSGMCIFFNTHKSLFVHKKHKKNKHKVEKTIEQKKVEKAKASEAIPDFPD